MTGDELRAWREAHDYDSQTSFGKDLARAAGRPKPVHQSTISLWESGKRAPPHWLPLALDRMNGGGR